MHCQSVRSNHINGLLRLFNAKSRVTRLGDELRRTDVGNEKCIGGILAGHRVALGHSGIDDGGPLAADTEGNVILFRCSREVAVDRRNFGMSSGERGDEDGVAQSASKKGDGGIDLVQIYFW